MREVIYTLLLVWGLSGCATRNQGRYDRSYAYTDSLEYVWRDSLRLLYNRQTQVQIRSELQELSFSAPDSGGQQYVERVVRRREEWGIADSAGVVAERSLSGQERQIQSVDLMEKKIVKKGHTTVWWILAGGGIAGGICVFMIMKNRR